MAKQIVAYHLFGISLGGPDYSQNWFARATSDQSAIPEGAELIQAGSIEKPHYYIAIKSLTNQVELHAPKRSLSHPKDSIYPGAFELLKNFCISYDIPFNNWDVNKRKTVSAGTAPHWFLALAEREAE